jgi:putative transposase
MDDLYLNRYRVSSARLQGWDYGSNGLYFVTICTKDRVHYFGEIESLETPETNNAVSLRMSEIGKVAYDNFQKIPGFHPYIELDDFVLMPDHLHCILFINKPGKIDWQTNKFGVQSNNLPSVIRGYKSSVKTYATINKIEFFWQSRYYDRVIRNEKEYWNIKQYITDNPGQWYRDKNNFENLLAM